MDDAAESALHFADQRSWRSDPYYSPAVASALSRAYGYLRAYPEDMRAAIQAHVLTSRYLYRRMAVPQRLNLLYVLGRSAAEMGEPTYACEMLEGALQDAVALHDRRATADLFYRSGAIKRGYTRVREGLKDLHATLDILTEMKHGPYASPTAADALLELRTLGDIASSACFLADYEGAERRLAQAQELQAKQSGNAFSTIRLRWTAGLIKRYTGQAERALPIFRGIAARVDRMASPGSYARVYSSVAESALDIVDAKSQTISAQRRASLLALAHASAVRAEILGVDCLDEPGAMVARLALVRHSLITNSVENRRGLIDRALQYAEDTEDTPLRIQALTTLAREWLAQGDSEAALPLLRRVVATASLSDVPFLGEVAKWLLHAHGAYEDWLG